MDTSEMRVEASRVRPQDEFIKTDSSIKPRRKPIRRCGSTFKVPTSEGMHYTVYTCSKTTLEHETEGNYVIHREEGRVRMKDGKIIEYDVSWNEGRPEVWRELHD
jgi:hypothetical protein